MKSKAGDDSVVNGTHYKYFVDGRGAGAGWDEAEKHERIKTNKTKQESFVLLVTWLISHFAEHLP